MISNFKFEISNFGPASAWAAADNSGSPTIAPPTAAPLPGQSPMTDIHDIKPILDMGRDWHWLVWGLVALAVMAAVLLAWWLWRRRDKGQAPVEAPLPTPEEEAYAMLDQLAVDRGADGKLFYFRLSAILRRYVERRYSFPAAEMTVEELLPRAGRLPLPQALLQPFNDLCRRAEPIKFAGVPAADHQRDHDLKFVREFVRQTVPVEVPPVDGPDKKNDQPWADRIATERSHNQTLEEQGNRLTK